MKHRSKDYKKMIKANKKLIMKDAKAASTDSFDWGIGLQVFVDHLYFMREYYELGENVWGAEAEGVPTRLQILNLILATYEEWINCENKYTVIIHKDEGEEKLKEYLAKGYFLQERDESPLFKDCYILYRYATFEENTKACSREYNRSRKRFFELLGEYIEYLWD